MPKTKWFHYGGNRVAPSRRKRRGAYTAESDNVLEQLLECVRHHYAPQTERWQRRRRDIGLPFDPTPPADDSLPF